MNNKIIGNNFESEYAKILSKKGYWVVPIVPKKNGSQPCDLIAIKEDIPILIDCKVSESHLFPLSRVEQNQRLAFRKYLECDNTQYFLVIKYKNRIYKIDMRTIDFDLQKNIDLEGEKFEDYS